MFGAPTPHHLAAFSPFDSSKMDKLDPMQNQMCRVCDEPAAGFHFGAFTCEGCKSFFGRTCNNQSVIQECKNNYRCVINKKNRTACKACRLRKCLMVGMSKSGSRYGRRSNWFKIHCLMQQASSNNSSSTTRPSSRISSSDTPPPPIPAPPSNPPSSNTLVSSRSSNHHINSPPLWRPLDSPSPKASPPSPVVPKVQSFAKAPPSPPPSLTTSSSSSGGTTASVFPPFTFPNAAAAASLYSPFGSALPFLPPTFNIPGLSALPIHKQALLSPLLASSHFLAAARKAYPFLPVSSAGSSSAGSETGSDLLAEHKALLERFRMSAAAMAAAAAFNNNKVQEEDDEKSASTPPPPANKDNPMDLTKRTSSEDSSVSSVGSEIIPHLSDTDEEDNIAQDNPEEPDQKKQKRKDELPLDLTCV